MGAMHDDDADVDQHLDQHSALLTHPIGRALVAAVVAVVAFSIVAPNMPSSTVRNRFDALWSPARHVGLVQDWGVFSPNPRSQSIDVRARIQLADGSIEFWDLPDLDPVIGAYRSYRWHKWQERVRLDNRQELWEPTALWLAREYTRDGVEPASITLIRRWIDHQPLTSDGRVLDGGWNEFEFYTWVRP